MIESLSTEMSDAILLTNVADVEDQETGLELTSMISSIVQQCSEKIFRVSQQIEIGSREVYQASHGYLDDSRESDELRRIVYVLIENQ